MPLTIEVISRVWELRQNLDDMEDNLMAIANMLREGGEAQYLFHNVVGDLHVVYDRLEEIFKRKNIE